MNVYVTDKRGFTAFWIADEIKVSIGKLHIRIGQKLIHLDDIGIVPKGRPDYPPSLYVRQGGDLGVYYFEEYNPYTMGDVQYNPKKYLHTA